MRYFLNTPRVWGIVVGLVSLGNLLIPATGRGQEEARDPEGITVLARGPVHEAFADPVLDQPAPQPVIAKRPPEPIEEVPPEQMPEGENVEWIPGYWAWDDDLEDFMWVSGVWRDIPPGRQWVPGYWAEVDGGWQWIAGYWVEAGQTELQYLPEPPASLEVGPSMPAPGDDYFYVPGCHIYRETRYVWRPGFWQRHYPDWCWMPARYIWTPLGCIFIDGHWDHALHRRGLLFAPIHVHRSFLGRPDWHYRPRHVVLHSALVGALFVNPKRGNYYFGDYFDARHSRRGLIPWVDFRVGRRVHDPLFAQHRFQHRDPDRWERDLRSLYVERRENESTRPPVEWRGSRDRDRDGSRTMLASLDRARDANLRLTDVSEAERAEATRRAKARSELRTERQKAELGDGSRGVRRATDQPRVIRRTPTEIERKIRDRAADSPTPKGVGKERIGKEREGVDKEDVRRPKIDSQGKEPPVRPKAEPRQPKAEPKGEPRQPKAEPREPKSEPREPRALPKKEPRPEPREPKAQPKSEPRPQPKAEPKAQPKSEPRQPKTEPRPQPPQPKAEPRSEPRPEPRAQPKAQPRAEPKARLIPPTEPRPEFKTQPLREPRAEPRRETRPQREAQPRPQVQPRPESQPRPQVQPRRESAPRPQAQPRPERRDAPRAESRPSGGERRGGEEGRSEGKGGRGKGKRD